MPEELFFTLPGDASRNPVLLWGLAVVKAAQNLKSPFFTLAMTLVSDLGLGLIVAAAAILFWCIDEKKGIRFGTILIVSSWINSFFKALLKQPRPFNFDETVGLAFEPTYGFPSGHSQSSFVFFMIMAFWLAEKQTPLKKIFVWGGAVFFTLLIAFSRVYLGVHFPTDVFGGWFLGGILVTVFFLAEGRIVKSLDAAGTRGRLIATAAAAFLMIVVFPEDSMLAGMLLGFAGGYVVIMNKAPFSVRGNLPCGAPASKVHLIELFGNLKFPNNFRLKTHFCRLKAEKMQGLGDNQPGCRTSPLIKAGLRFLAGIAGAAIVYYLLRLVLSEDGLLGFFNRYERNFELGRFIRYGLLGFWISAGAPFIFVKLKLAEGRN